MASTVYLGNGNQLRRVKNHLLVLVALETELSLSSHKIPERIFSFVHDLENSIVMATPLGKKKNKQFLMRATDISRFPCIQVCFSETFDITQPQSLARHFN